MCRGWGLSGWFLCQSVIGPSATIAVPFVPFCMHIHGHQSMSKWFQSHVPWVQGGRIVGAESPSLLL